ncbi:proline-rich transmembrane protein 3-like [Montipora capricornis]|uniref:proline-rich transmembrane protein 3-like n=1 Tax=Montipora capricornis TaxID=246305 RepID=UPI0035F15077
MEWQTSQVGENNTNDVLTMSNDIPVGEPVPNFEEAKPLWGVAWEIHWIGLGVAFGLLSVISAIALLRAHKKKRFGRKPYVNAINALLLVLGVTRAVYLLLDPYGSKQNGVKLPMWLAGLLFNISFPCLTSAFCLILYVFLGVAKLQLVSKRLQNARFFGAVISFHFAVVLVGEICMIFAPEVAVIIFIFCHLFFIVWGLVLSASFIYGGLKVICSVKKVSRRLQAQRRTSSSKVAKVTLVTSFLGLSCSILHTYSLLSVYRFYRELDEPPDPWMWWSFHTFSRLIEIGMACNISYCIMQPADSAARKRSSTIHELTSEGVV